MRTILIAMFIAFCLFSTQACSEDKGCFVADSIKELKASHLNEAGYTLFLRTSGFGEKEHFFELFDVKAIFNDCGQTTSDPVFKIHVDDTEGFPTKLNISDNKIEIVYSPDNKNQLTLGSVKIEVNKPLLNQTIVNQLLQQNLAADAKLTESVDDPFKVGDFNGDGRNDIAALFTFDAKPKPSAKLRVMMPWHTQQQNTQADYRTGLAILHGNGEPWLSGKKQTFALIDTIGILETPSFELWVKCKTDEDYDAVRSMLPAAVSDDLIVLPTEAGIDTYLYWNQETYLFFEPDEMP